MRKAPRLDLHLVQRFNLRSLGHEGLHPSLYSSSHREPLVFSSASRKAAQSRERGVGHTAVGDCSPSHLGNKEGCVGLGAAAPHLMEDKCAAFVLSIQGLSPPPPPSTCFVCHVIYCSVVQSFHSHYVNFHLNPLSLQVICLLCFPSFH